MNQNENFTPIHLREREKFERLKSQAELKAQWADAMLRGEPFVVECLQKSFSGTPENWFAVEPMWQDECTYRRKPEPTLEERNAAVRKEWEAMRQVTPGVRLNASGRKCVCEWREGTSDVWIDNIKCYSPAKEWANRRDADMPPIEYRIRELSTPRIEPFTFETCPPYGSHVAWKTAFTANEQGASIIAKSRSEVVVGTSRYDWRSAMEALWLIPDPSKPDERRPFGLEVAP